MKDRLKSMSLRAVLAVVVIMLSITIITKRWKGNQVISGDVVSYYSYLPAAVIHGDLTMEYVLGDDFYKDKVWGVIWKDGMGPTQKYTYGMSLMYAPFFLAGHATAMVGPAPADGYSMPYRIWLQFSAVFFLVLGLVFLRKVLLRYFNEKATTITLLVLALGTNLFFYTVGHGTMPHVYLFALISIFLHLSIRFNEAPGWKVAIFLALTGGLITLIRPNHIILWLLPLLYGVYDANTLGERIRFVGKHFPKYLLWPVVVALLVIPQMFYWHLLTDRWLYYSYGDEGFFFGNPQFFRTLFSFRNGWLIYSPLMITGLLGIFVLRKIAREASLVLPLVFLLAAYVICSWWCWWYGGNFGNRVFIDFYPLLAFGIAALTTFLAQKLSMRPLRIALASVILLFCLLNIFQSYQYTKGIIHYDSMTARAWFGGFGRLKKPANFEELLEAPDYDAAMRGEY